MHRSIHRCIFYNRISSSAVSRGGHEDGGTGGHGEDYGFTYEDGDSEGNGRLQTFPEIGKRWRGSAGIVTFSTTTEEPVREGPRWH
jgi:hypothetical protein